MYSFAYVDLAVLLFEEETGMLTIFIFVMKFLTLLLLVSAMVLASAAPEDLKDEDLLNFINGMYVPSMNEGRQYELMRQRTGQNFVRCHHVRGNALS